MGVAPNTATDVKVGQFILSPGHPPITFSINCGYNDGVAGSSIPFCYATFTLQTPWFYRDLDGDGFGALASGASAYQLPGFVNNNSDCNDSDPTINPNTPWYRDLDGDGFGSPSSGTLTQCAQPAGFVRNTADCNDADATINPNTTWFRDLDGDGFGAASSGTLTQCAQPAGFVRSSTDCNDSNAALNPNTIWYRDLDGDGFGHAPDGTIAQCTPPSGYSQSNSDNCPTLANPTQADCDSDSRGDVCEIASGESSDWNGNGAPDACAGEFVVGASGGFATIQAAVTAAPAGATITVTPGTYGPVDLGSRSVNLLGAGGAGGVIIDAQQLDSCLRMFNVTGPQPTIERITFRNGLAENGGGLAAVLASPTVRDCVFEHCGASNYGGGLFLNGSAALIERSTMRECSAVVGGGCAVVGGSSLGAVRLVDCTILDNQASGRGGGIFTKSSFVMTGSTVTRNTSPLGGGVLFEPTGSGSLGSSSFCLNTPDATDGPFFDLGGNDFGEDCNGNGACDRDEISDDASRDTDHDGRLDSCERARGDLDLDGTVTGSDLALLLGAWGQGANSIADIDHDGVVGGSDLSRLLGNWGT